MPRAKETPTNSTAVKDDSNIARDMWETAFIIAFCEKFKPALRNFEFWPEELERALQSGVQEELLEDIHCTFLTNLLNRKKPIEREVWQKFLSSSIEEHLKDPMHDFYLDYNPLRSPGGTVDYFQLGIKDKVSILHSLVNWQLKESDVIRNLIADSYKHRFKRSHDNPLEIEDIGEDSKHTKYYYIGNGARIYKEKFPRSGSSITNKNVKWEVVSTTIEDIQNLLNDGFASKRSKHDKELFETINGTILPHVQNLYTIKSKKMAQQLRQAKRSEELALMRINAVSTRTRAASRKAAGIDAPQVNYREDDFYYEDAEEYHEDPEDTRKRKLRSSKARGGNLGSSAASEISNSDLSTTQESEYSYPTIGLTTRSRARRSARNQEAQSQDAQSSISSEISNSDIFTDTAVMEDGGQNESDYKLATDFLMQNGSEIVTDTTLENSFASNGTNDVKTNDHHHLKPYNSFVSGYSVMSIDSAPDQKMDEAALYESQ